jgi:hypothetical protein
MILATSFGDENCSYAMGQELLGFQFFICCLVEPTSLVYQADLHNGIIEKNSETKKFFIT